jgi:hypothetical protein
MPLRLSRIAIACAMTLVFCASGRSQNAASVNDQKNKDNQSVTKVNMKQKMQSGSSSGSTGVAGKTAQVGHLATGSLDQLAPFLDQLSSMSRAALVKDALQGHDVNFPGRKEWEDKLMNARDTFISECRVLLQRAQQMGSPAGGQSTVQEQIQDIVQDFQKAGAAFLAVIAEGQKLAARPKAH